MGIGGRGLRVVIWSNIWRWRIWSGLVFIKEIAIGIRVIRDYDFGTGYIGFRSIY